MTEDRTRYPIEDISGRYSHADEAVMHAINSLEALLAKPRFSVPKGTSRVYLEMRRDMPYVIHETSRPQTHILVNRNYKPLGSNSRGNENHVVYEDHCSGHVVLTEAEIATVVSPGRKRGLFGDDNPPWAGRSEAAAYLARLKKLHALLVTGAAGAV